MRRAGVAKRALITGITGQDGSYLAEFLAGRGYQVFGTVRQLSNPNLRNIAHLLDRVELISADLLDPSSLHRALERAEPDEVYNLAAMSFVKTSFDQPVLTAEVTATAVTRVLEAIRKTDKGIRFYQASSSEMFGKVTETPQRETTRFHPRSPYGVAKVFGHHITVNYRESYDMFACSGILFNHESPRRGIEFVTRKISHAVARINAGRQDTLELGNLTARRDWGFSGDYVEAMWLMLQQDRPDDYVIATGEAHSVQEFVEVAFKQIGVTNWQQHVVADDPRYLRPAEVDFLLGDYGKARDRLGWAPRTSFAQLVTMMVEADIRRQRPPA